MKKQTTSLLLALALCFGLAVPALAANAFSDVPGGNWAAPYVEQAAEKGWVSGVGGGKYEPNASVTYSQFAVMLDKALYPEDFAAQPAGAKWWTAPCEVAARHGLFADTDMADRAAWEAAANTPIEREQMAQMMYNALVDLKAELPSYEEYSEVSLGIRDIIDVDNYDAVSTCYAVKLLNGDDNGNFNAHDPMTRAQAAVVLCNIYGYVTGGTAVPEQPAEPAKPDASRPAGAVGGRYDVNSYDVPADTNKDGWITEAEVQAVLDQLRVEYPDGSEWGLKTRYPGLPNGAGMGSASACAGFANMVSDRIFGNLPAYEVSLEETRVGDIMDNDPADHRSIVLNDYGEDVFEGVNYTESYTTANGNSSGHVAWDSVRFYDEWPVGVGNTRIRSRYPQE